MELREKQGFISDIENEGSSIPSKYIYNLLLFYHIF